MGAMDTYQKMETVQAEQWNKLGDVKEAGVQKYEQTNDGWLGSNCVRAGDYIVKAYDIETDSTVYYPVPKEEFENLLSKVIKPAWEGDVSA